MEFNVLLTTLRESKGLTMKTVAESIGVKPDTYRNYETGRFQPNFETLSKLADFYGVSTDYLLGRTQEKIEPLEALANEKNMHIVEKTMLEMYFKLGAERRADFVEAMINAIQSSDDQEHQTEIKVRHAARSGTPPSTGTITKAEADDVRNRPDADSDL